MSDAPCSGTGASSDRPLLPPYIQPPARAKLAVVFPGERAPTSDQTRTAMLRNARLADILSFVAAVSLLCLFANSSVAARPAKSTAPVASTAKQAPIRTDLTPRDKRDCLAVAQSLSQQVKKLSQQTKQGIPSEFTRVVSDLNQSCGAEEFKKAWISIEWMNGCLNNFTKDAELGF